MTTLKKIFLDNQDKFTSEFDEEDVPYWVIENSVKEWLQQNRIDTNPETTKLIGAEIYDAEIINAFIDEKLLEDLEK